MPAAAGVALSLRTHRRLRRQLVRTASSGMQNTQCTGYIHCLLSPDQLTQTITLHSCRDASSLVRSPLDAPPFGVQPERRPLRFGASLLCVRKGILVQK
jgi:hypothetical protein